MLNEYRANTEQNIVAEANFICPGYWMVEAYGADAGRSGWKYQFSVAPATHGADTAGYFGQASSIIGPDLTIATQSMLQL